MLEFLIKAFSITSLVLIIACVAISLYQLYTDVDYKDDNKKEED